jgi:hypothetical protein
MNKQLESTNEISADIANSESVWNLLEADVLMIGGGELGLVII